MGFWAWQDREVLAALAGFADAAIAYLGLTSYRVVEGNFLFGPFRRVPWGPPLLMLVGHLSAHAMMVGPYPHQARVWLIAAVAHGGAALWSLTQLTRG